MTIKNRLLFILLFLCQLALSQQDTIVIEEVILSDIQLNRFLKTKKITSLNDSVVSKNASSLTSLLNYNSLIYFKENGLGMVSSPSFRGTTAQQTAVIWNGININSQLNGQTDFNTIVSRNYNSIQINSGGGSTIYGTSAIGGSVHLSNVLSFDNKFSNQFSLRYGSYSTFNSDYSLQYSNKKISTNFSFSRNSSENDYRYLNTNLRNENGQYLNNSFNLSFGYKFNSNNYLKFYSNYFDGKRNLSRTIAADSRSKYLDLNSRNLIEYSNFYNKTISKVRIAYLTEEYNYFEDKNEPIFSFGKSESFIFKYDFLYRINDKNTINALVDYTKTKGFGSDINSNSREIISNVLLFKQKISSRINYEIGIRKEFTSNYQSPFLYSFGTQIDVTKKYQMKFNFSKNFRIPTFNDLYWQPGGNLNLKPESAYQFDLNQQIKFKNSIISVSGFYNKISDMIVWNPSETGFWQPININKVTTYGVETSFNFDKKITRTSFLKINTNYGYTISENEKTDKQLIYVPYHKLVSNVAFTYKKITFSLSHLFNGAVFTSLDNSYVLKEYNVVNNGLEYQFFKKYKIGFQVNNILNENYQTVIQRPFPGRNYSINFNFNL